MPTYEYRCPKCGTEFETFQKITAKAVAKCPKCGARATRLMSSGAGLVFKGSGFYLTDYGRAGQKAKPSEGEGGSATAEKSVAEKSSDKSAASADKPAASKPAAPGKSRKKDD